ncbi:CrcB protein [Dysgonomonadaceae bacterium PH5-43]|nr:CrcB protein [Dysgonomonadaceae bacterium PH5-43]
MIKILLSIFLGGGLGSVCRYILGLGISRILPTVGFISTFGVNVIGSFIIGALWASPFISSKPMFVGMLIVGFCGGFTTFSSFSWESFNLIKQGEIGMFFIYSIASVIVCLLATWGGYALTKAIT